VLAAMGVGRRAQAGQLCLEQLVLSLPAAAVGLLAGIGLARLMVPAITLTADAAAPWPPALPVLPLGLAAALASAAALPAGRTRPHSCARRPDKRGQPPVTARRWPR
jgi:ABC-type antimicrobial peptide transport system permease subunit